MQPWVDIAKGICILLVVLMHTVLGIQKDVGQGGYLIEVVAWTKPFRMPDFFILSGFLAARSVTMSWRDFLDRKVLHYAYFYVLWLAIVIVVKAAPAGLAALPQIAVGLVRGLFEPFSTLWFIYILPFFMLAARLAKGWIALVIGFVAVILHMAASAYPAGGAYAMSSQMTASTAFNSIAMFFVFFLTGFFGRPLIERVVQWTRRSAHIAFLVLVGWAIAHSAALHQVITGIPGLTLIFGIAGGVAVVILATLLSRCRVAGWLAYCGQHSLAIYLAFVIPMAVTREILVEIGGLKQPDLLAIVVLASAVLLPLLLVRATAGRAFAFLFKRPSWARLSTPGRT